METSKSRITFVWLGDLHLTEASLPNHRAAAHIVREVNGLIKPDFVQFAGDNVQHAKPMEFHLFNKLRSDFTAPHYVLVGDHDIHEDPEATAFIQHVGETYGSVILNEFRFIRLNTLESRPVGISDAQLAWLRDEMQAAKAANERIVLFQHHYPYKVWEQFAGPGVEAWWQVVQANRIEGIFCGHTHYGQIANDGRNVSVATRSIGDPEGGPPGYSIVHLSKDDFAITYRTIENSGPVALITHPRDVLLALAPQHIVSGEDHVEIRVWSEQPVSRVMAQVGRGPQFSLEQVLLDTWRAPLLINGLAKGKYMLQAEVVDANGTMTRHSIRFMFDPTGRYTAIPMVDPIVDGTAFC